MNERTFKRFCQQVQVQLDGKAKTKGYNATGPDKDNRLYEFVRDTIGGHGHAAGEVIYKVRRFMTLGNPEDVEKAAAWLFLIWKHEGR